MDVTVKAERKAPPPASPETVRAPLPATPRTVAGARSPRPRLRRRFQGLPLRRPPSTTHGVAAGPEAAPSGGHTRPDRRRRRPAVPPGRGRAARGLEEAADGVGRLALAHPGAHSPPDPAPAAPALAFALAAVGSRGTLHIETQPPARRSRSTARPRRHAPRRARCPSGATRSAGAEGLRDKNPERGAGADGGRAGQGRPDPAVADDGRRRPLSQAPRRDGRDRRQPSASRPHGAAD